MFMFFILKISVLIGLKNKVGPVGVSVSKYIGLDKKEKKELDS